jgi:hypothetical protein
MLRVTGFSRGATGTLTSEVRTGLLQLQICQHDRIAREDLLEFEPEPAMPGAGFFDTTHFSRPIRT